MSASIFDLLKEPEIMELKEKYHEVTGEWLAYHWDCFGSIDEYKKYMRKRIAEYEHNTTSQLE